MNLITNTEKLTRESELLAKNIRKVDDRIQVYLLSEIAHIEEHRNCTRLDTFLKSVKGSGARVNAMHSFVQTYGNIKFDDTNEDKEKHKYKMRPKRTKAAFDEVFAKAVDDHWCTHKPEAAPKDFSLDAQIAQLIDRAEKVQTNDNWKGNKDINPDHLAALKQILVA